MMVCVCGGGERGIHNYIYGERSRGRRRETDVCVLLMMANKPETALYKAPTFSLLLVSHGGISSSTYVQPLPNTNIQTPA